MKKLLISWLIRFVFGAIALGVGIWYISSSIGGESLTYTSLDGFMNAVGAKDGNIASVNGCFMCKYVNDLFMVLGDSTELFWNTILEYLWVLLAVGFGIFLFVHAIKHISKSADDATKYDTKDVKFDFKSWFEPVWRQGIRILFVGALIGALGMGGTGALKTVSNITIKPVMLIGTELSMAATGMTSSAQCNPNFNNQDNPMSSISGSFMCIVGNINAIMLAGASGGFALMNYAWMGLGGGLFTWLSGFGVVILFLIMGFDLFFKLLSVIFKLIFLIIFLPMFIAGAAFEKTWKLSSGLLSKGIDMLIGSAVRVIAISLQVVIMFSVMFYAADSYFPGPVDGYSSILPPIFGKAPENLDAQAMSVANVFSKCEKVSLTNGVVDGDKFKACFKSESAIVEQKYPGAFDFTGDGWGFLLLMMGLFFLYFYVVGPRVDSLLASVKIGTDTFDDFGGELKKFGKIAWNKPQELANKINEIKNG